VRGNVIAGELNLLGTIQLGRAPGLKRIARHIHNDLVTHYRRLHMADTSIVLTDNDTGRGQRDTAHFTHLSFPSPSRF
jgi:hypothetical protein